MPAMPALSPVQALCTRCQVSLRGHTGGGKGSEWKTSKPTEGCELPWAGPPWGWGGSFPQTPGEHVWAVGQRRKPGPFLVVSEYYPFYPSSPLCLISTARKAGKSRAGPPTLGKSHHTAPSSAPPAALPLGASSSIQARRAKHRLPLGLFPKGSVSPRKPVSSSLPFPQGLASRGFSPQVSPGP